MRSKKPIAWRGGVAVAMALTVVGLAGCSEPDPTNPAGSQFSAPGSTVLGAGGFGSGSFYPLQVGNDWSYEGGGSFFVITNGIPGDPEFTYAFTETHRLIGTVDQGGATYTVEEQVRHDVPEDLYDPTTSWIRFRQDPAGLFVRDTVITSASSSGAQARLERRFATNPGLQRLARRLETLRRSVRDGGHTEARSADAAELTQLLYPLRVGQSWSIRPDFPWPARVDRVESLDTPAGRITAYRLELDPFGTTVHEGEWVRVWWSREGFLGYSIHSLGEETDDNGQLTGGITVGDEVMMVTGIHLVR